MVNSNHDGVIKKKKKKLWPICDVISKQLLQFYVSFWFSFGIQHDYEVLKSNMFEK